MPNENGECCSSTTARSTTSSAARRARGAGPPLSFAHRQRGHLHGYEMWGDDCVDTAERHVRVRHLGRAAAQSCLLARDRSASSRSTTRDGDDGRLRLRDQGAAAASRASASASSCTRLLEYFTFQNSSLTARCSLASACWRRAGDERSRRTGRPPAVLGLHYREPQTPRRLPRIPEELRRLFGRRSSANWSPTCRSAPISAAAWTRAVSPPSRREPDSQSRLLHRRLRSLVAPRDSRSALRRTAARRGAVLSVQDRALRGGAEGRRHGALLPDLIWHQEDLRVGQCYPNFYVSRLAGKFVKVVLAGTGGDELYGGYPVALLPRASTTTSTTTWRVLRFWQRLVAELVHHRFSSPRCGQPSRTSTRLTHAR